MRILHWAGGLGRRHLTETEAVEKLIREISGLDRRRNSTGRRVIYLFLLIGILSWLLLLAVAVMRVL